MSCESEEFSPPRCARLPAMMVALVVGSAIALANLSSESVTADLVDAAQPERAYGWPLTSYWRCAKCLPGTVQAYLPQYYGPVVPSRLCWPISRCNAYSLSANLATWLVILAVTFVACEWVLRRYRLRLHWRPRVSTLFLLIMASAPIALANLSFDSPRSWKASFGWPLIWVRYVIVSGKALGPVRGWDYSASRLFGNLVIWLLILAVVGFTWECVLRRYRPRLRWSLRTMFLGVASLAMLCAWFAAANKRAVEQDALVAWAGDDNVLVERWGPIWLDIVGADGFRRRVVGARLQLYRNVNGEIPKNLGQLQHLRYLEIDGDLVTRVTAAGLGNMRQLRTLIIHGPVGNEEAAHECVLWLGNLDELERLRIEICDDIRNEDLVYLSGLASLKSLTLDEHHSGKEHSAECLAAVGKLTQLERLSLKLDVHSEDLMCLVSLTQLRSLIIDTRDPYDNGEIAHEFLAAAGRLTRLERLSMTVDSNIPSDDLAYLGGLTDLKSLTLNLGITSRESISPGDNEQIETLASLPVLQQLEALDLHGTTVGDQAVRRLAVFPRLKWLNLNATLVSDAGLAELAPLESLEELWIDHRVATAAGLKSLAALKRLRAVHITGSGGSAVVQLDSAWPPFSVPPSEVDSLRQGLRILRECKAGVIIDSKSYKDPFDDTGEFEPPSRLESNMWADRGYYHSVVRKCISEP